MTTFYITPKKNSTGTTLGTVIEVFASESSFPVSGNLNQFYRDANADTLFFWNGTEYIQISAQCDIEGGAADTIYLAEQCVDGGMA